MNRRDFLKGMSRDALQIAAEAIGQAVPPKPPTARSNRSGGWRSVPSAGSPRQYRQGDLVLVEDALAWLGLDEVGFYAIDAVCPHLGCLVRRVGGHFLCLCHGSRFRADGSHAEGPALRGMRHLQVDLDDGGRLVIRREKAVAPDDRFIA